MLCVYECLRFPITSLLIKVSTHCITTEVPDYSGRAEANNIAGVLKAPAYIHIIAGRAVDRIETAEPQQCLAGECHVAARNVFGDLVADQHMCWTTGCDRDDRRDEGVLRWREIGTAASGEIVRLHFGDEIGQPIGVGDAVAVGVSDNITGRRLGADIACDAQPLVGLADYTAKAIAFGDL